MWKSWIFEKYQKFQTLLLWDSVDKVSNNELGKLVGAIPLIGYFILFNDGIATNIEFDALAGTSGSQDSPFFISSIWKLRLAFIGSLLAFTGNLVFRVASPRILGSSKDSISFSNRVVQSYSLDEIRTLEEHGLGIKKIHRSQLLMNNETFNVASKQGGSFAIKYTNRRPFLDEYEDYVRVVAREYWYDQMHSRKLMRVCSLILSAFGFALLAIPTLDISQAVLREIFYALTGVVTPTEGSA